MEEFEKYLPMTEDIENKEDFKEEVVLSEKRRKRTPAEERKLSFKAENKRKQQAADGRLGRNYLKDSGCIASWGEKSKAAYKKADNRKARQENKKIPDTEEETA